MVLAIVHKFTSVYRWSLHAHHYSIIKLSNRINRKILSTSIVSGPAKTHFSLFQLASLSSPRECSMATQGGIVSSSASLAFG